MDMHDDKDLAKLSEILRRTGEFIAYFELAEQKMLEWRENLAAREMEHNKNIDERFARLNHHLEEIESCFTQAGIARFKLQITALLEQSARHLEAIDKAERKLLLKSAVMQRELHQLSDEAIKKINESAEVSVAKLDKVMSQFCSHQDKPSHSPAPPKAPKHGVHTMVASALGACLIAFGVGFYLTDEAPWEVHQKAVNERVAGKMLERAWSKLSVDEREKILAEHPMKQTTLHG